MEPGVEAGGQDKQPRRIPPFAGVVFKEQRPMNIGQLKPNAAGVFLGKIQTATGTCQRR